MKTNKSVKLLFAVTVVAAATEPYQKRAPDKSRCFWDLVLLFP
jgi:hypothetical protein